ALAVLAVFLVLLVVLTAAPASQLLRGGTAPARPRRLWLTLLVVRELGTAGVAAAAAWTVLANPGTMPAWAAAALAGAVAYLAAEVIAPVLGLALPAEAAARVSDVVAR